MSPASHLLAATQTALRMHRALRAGASCSPVRISAFCFLALISRWPSLSKSWGINDFRDAHYLVQYEDAARRAVVQFHQLPLWNPYYCGGIYALGSPQARYVSPTFLLSLWLGASRAEALIAMAMVILGLEGAYQYAKARKASSLAAAVAAPIFALSGMFSHALSLGWTHFYGFELVPWVLWGLRRGLRGSRRGLLVSAFALAWMVGFGGTYAVPLTAVFCFLECIEAVVSVRTRPHRWLRLGRLIIMSLALVFLATGLSAVRLWPIFETLSAAPRLVGGHPSISFQTIASDLFTPNEKSVHLIGLWSLPVAALALRRRRSLAIIAGALIALLLATGYDTSPSLFALLRELPVYKLLRYPERFLLFVALAVTLLAATGVHNLDLAIRRRPYLVWSEWAAIGLLTVNSVTLTSHHHWLQRRTRIVEPSVEADRDFKQARGNRWLAAYYPALARGSLSCFDDYDVPQSGALRGDLPQEEYLSDPTSGRVTRTSWSPNTIRLAVELLRPNRLLVNQNFHSGWRANLGQVVDDQGRISVDLPAGKHDLVLRFLPSSAIGGFTVSLLSLFAAFRILRDRHRHGDTVAVGGRKEWRWLVPIALPTLGGSLIASSTQPRYLSSLSLTTPSGSPAVLDALPRTSSPLGVVFDGGIILEGAVASIDTSESIPRLVVELDFRIPSKVPAGLGVFIHATSSDGRTLSLDHVRLASRVPFEVAPPNRILRDIAAAELFDAKGSVWEVYAGLWTARLAGRRLGVRQRGTGRVNDNRVWIGRVKEP